MPSYYPVVYIRGYARSAANVEEAFNLPYYGFNLGSTQYRQGLSAEPEMHIFESPVVRLMKDHGYTDAFGDFTDPQGNPMEKTVPKAIWRQTLWIFRYYDLETEMFGGDRPTFPLYAARLLVFLNKVRLACGNPAGFRVNLVAHSMGGLISRCYLQGSGAKVFKDAVTEVKKEGAKEEHLKTVTVNKLFTYGTPHGGIAFRQTLAPVNWVREITGAFREDQFTPAYMRTYLGLAGNKDPRTYKPAGKHAPALDRTFSLVGTNAMDYTVAGAQATVGAKSDGLVLTEKAHIHGGPRAYVDRAHSGPLGIVNSEEGYQNLQRFLFGNWRFQVRLRFGSVREDAPSANKNEKLTHLSVDVAVALRGYAGYLDSRREQNMTAETIPMKKSRGAYVPVGERDPVLFTGYLFAGTDHAAYRAVEKDAHARWLLQLAIRPHYERRGLFSRSGFEGDVFFDGRIEFALADKGADPPFGCRWQGAGVELTAPKQLQGSKGKSVQYAIPLAAATDSYFKNVDLLVEVSPWE